MESGKPNQKNFNYNLGYSTRADTTINTLFLHKGDECLMNIKTGQSKSLY